MTAQTLPAADRTTFLRRMLQIDAAGVLAGSVVLAAGAGWVETSLGIPAAFALPTGLALLPFAAWIVYTSTRPVISSRAVWSVMILNALWVVESIALLVAGWMPLTSAGWWVVLIQALVGGMQTELEYIGLRRI
jgi:hypothetical protein